MDRLAHARSILQVAETRTGVRPPDEEDRVPDALRGLLPRGVPAGGIVHVSGSRTIVWSLAATLMGSRGWCVVIGLRDVGWYAAKQAGLDLARVLYLPTGATPPVLAAAIDGADVLIVGSARSLGAGDQRAVAGRLRNRGTRLITTIPWPGATQITASVVHAHGCDDGAGYLTERVIHARSEGRSVRLAAGDELTAYRPLAVVS